MTITDRSLSANAVGALWMSASMAGFTINDALMKRVGVDLPLFQIIFLRGLAATVLVAALGWRAGAFRARPDGRAWRLIGWRTVGELGSTFCFLTALMQMPLAGVSAVLQTAPIALTFYAVLFLGEQVGWRRWSAIIAGFVGVLLVVRPGAESFDPAALIAVAAMLFVCLRDLTTRWMPSGLPSLLVAAVASAAVTLAAGLATLRQGWAPVSPAGLAGLAAAAGFLLLGYIASIAAMRTGELSVVGLFRYTVLIWAAGLGWALLGETPPAATFLGAAIIAAAGLTTIRRGTMRAK